MLPSQTLQSMFTLKKKACCITHKVRMIDTVQPFLHILLANKLKVALQVSTHDFLNKTNIETSPLCWTHSFVF